MLDGPPRAAGVANTKYRVPYRHDDAHGHDAYFPMGRLTDRNETSRPFARFHA